VIVTTAEPAAQALWTDAFLTALRQQGDPVADETIRRIFERGEAAELNAFMGRLVANDEIPADIPDELRAFLAETDALPTWHNRALIHEAERLFNIFGLISLVSLVAASLPECYTMRTGVRILDLTGQLGEHTNRRLHQTAVMVLSVMGKHGLDEQGRGVRQAQKVRLIHAAIRYRILGAIGAGGVPTAAGGEVPVVIPGATQSVADIIARHRFDWDLARDGFPINQEDLAFTLLTFGFVIPRAMMSLGVPLTEQEFRAFLHAWNCVGYVMGVDERLMAHTPLDAAVLFTRIKARQAGPSPAGARLTNALLEVMERDLLKFRVFRPAAPILMRILVGDDTAKMLGLDVRHAWLVRMIHKAVAGIFRRWNMMTGRFFARFHPLTRIAAKLGQRFVTLLTTITYRGGRPQLEIPPEWGGTG
jgi:hypothetical protein